MNINDHVIYSIRVFNGSHFCVVSYDYNYGLDHECVLGCATHERDAFIALKNLAKLLISDYSNDITVDYRQTYDLAAKLKNEINDKGSFRICGLFIREFMECKKHGPKRSEAI